MNKTIENLKKLKSFHNGSYGADIDKAIKSLEFAEWVAEEIFSEDWEFNEEIINNIGKDLINFVKDSFAEVACRKLEKAGIVKLIDGYWALVESEE